MSNLIQIKVAELNQLDPLMIAEDNRVEQKFIQMYNAIWGTAQGAQIYEKEKFNFRKILQDKPELQKCTPLSLYGCFLDIAVNGLSLDPDDRTVIFFPVARRPAIRITTVAISTNYVLISPSPDMAS